MDDQRAFSWVAMEHEGSEHSSDWYWGFGATTIAVAIVSIFFSNLLLALIFLLGGFSYMAFSARKPEEVTVSITNRGVRVGGALYPFSDLSAYSFDLEPPRRRLVLISSRAIVSHIYLPLDADEDVASRAIVSHIYLPLDADEDVVAIRAHMEPFIDEVSFMPTLADRITEYL
ncbi:MAG: hypothetical protein UY80_C0037G0004 [Parcubacteria group bacterium GW2011_GWB1_53_43]|nr:MAG: hypothetical protein UY80_C0037G0004 [Parcubacteria group bacterium GW2011_GWB1_53_43]